MLAATGDLHPLEPLIDPDVDVEVTSVLVEVEEGPRALGEVTALALAQLRELTKLSQEFLQPVKVLLRCVPHASSMTMHAAAAQEPPRAPRDDGSHRDRRAAVRPEASV
jgi:hypothetical protein